MHLEYFHIQQSRFRPEPNEQQKSFRLKRRYHVIELLNQETITPSPALVGVVDIEVVRVINSKYIQLASGERLTYYKPGKAREKSKEKSLSLSLA